MLVMIAAAVLGAALGLMVRPWLLAAGLAVALGAGVQGLLIYAARQLSLTPGHEGGVEALDKVAGAGISALWPTVAAAAVAALLAALLNSLFGDRGSGRGKFWMPSDQDSARARGRDGRLRRLEGMVEEREIHAKAESRIKSILDR
jgi:hypothetical protein